MSSTSAPGADPALIRSLDESTREIDQTFATVGDRLGRGLAIFETLNGCLGAMSTELVGSDMDGTRNGLLAIVNELRAFSSSLPDEACSLQEIARHGNTAAQFLERLLDHIRLISAVASSARIEAAQVQRSRNGRDYFDEISSLVAQAKRTIESCAQDHDRLTGLLVSAIEVQRGFAAVYGETLAGLAGQLHQTLGHIEDRRQRSVKLTVDAAEHSRKVADAVGGAIIALQCGDSTRQRLEHSLFTLRLPGAISAGTCAEAAHLSEAGQTALSTILGQLVAGQLQATAETMVEEVGEIDLALQMLVEDMAATTSLSRSLYGGDDPDGASFLDALEGELSQASDLVGKCSAARAQVNGVSDALVAFVDQFRQTAVSLSETARNIVLIGVNSGLHASRLGNDGLGLVVIAHELKAVADKIADDAAQLSPIFELMQAATTQMKTRYSGGAANFVALDETIRPSIAWMKQSGGRLQATLGELVQDSTAFAAAVDDARLSFSRAGATGNMIAETADRLRGNPAGPCGTLPIPDRTEIEAFVNKAVWPIYTMAVERQIHLASLDACGCSVPTAAAAKPALFDDLPPVAA